MTTKGTTYIVVNKENIKQKNHDDSGYQRFLFDTGTNYHREDKWCKNKGITPGACRFVASP